MKSLLLFILISSTFSAFAQDAEFEAIKTLAQATKQLADKDLSCRTLNDCQIIEIGHKSCGGPAAHLVTSKKNANLEEILYLAERVSERQQDYNRTSGGISNCSILMPPAFSCLSNKCVSKIQ